MTDKLYNQLINWHLTRHEFKQSNEPNNPASKCALNNLVSEILAPLEQQLAPVKVTYGFTNYALTRYVQKHSKADTAIAIDQHASYEQNLRGNYICKRGGAACDIYVEGYENRMHEVVQYICDNIEFDRLYFYGKDRPIHISWNEAPLKHLQVLKRAESGNRHPTKRAYDADIIKLANEL